MNVIITSACSKNALKLTRQVVDHFAERMGERHWQTSITAQGLTALYQNLRRRARKNTAVACHGLKADGRKHLLWIVGNRRRFDAQGRLPTHSSSRNLLRMQDENHWHTGQSIKLLASLGGLFHDLGKANVCFQAKLGVDASTGLADPAKAKNPPKEAVRHEWLSLRLFEALVRASGALKSADDVTWPPA